MHEHPAGSTAWEMPEIKLFIMQYGVNTVTTNMCSFGMTARDDQGEGLVCKPTKIMSSAGEVLKRIYKPCAGGHRHVHLVSGRARAAQVYPRSFCRTICQGIAAQKKLDNLGMEARPVLSVEEMTNAAKSAKGEDPSTALHERYGNDVIALDDLNGEVLDPILMAKARKDEIEYFKHMGVYDNVNVDEAWKEIGKAPIPVRWVDINIGDRKNPNYRSRFGCQGM